MVEHKFSSTLSPVLFVSSGNINIFTVIQKGSYTERRNLFFLSHADQPEPSRAIITHVINYLNALIDIEVDHNYSISRRKQIH